MNDDRTDVCVLQTEERCEHFEMERRGKGRRTKTKPITTNAYEDASPGSVAASVEAKQWGQGGREQVQKLETIGTQRAGNGYGQGKMRQKNL